MVHNQLLVLVIEKLTIEVCVNGSELASTNFENKTVFPASESPIKRTSDPFFANDFFHAKIPTSVMSKTIKTIKIGFISILRAGD